MQRRHTSPLALSALLAAALIGCDSDNGLLPAPPADDLPALAVELLDLDDYTFNQPVGITHAGDGSGRLFVIERPGTIRVIEEDEVALQPFLDLTGLVHSTNLEQGLLGLAFPPDYTSVDGHFYIHYTTVAGNGFAAGDSIVSRIPVSNGIADPLAEEILLHVAQPLPNHNGGQLAFGPDGFLYIAIGDGGGSGDPDGNGQNLNTLLGKLLRIDVEGGVTDNIPADNPFAGPQTGLDEIWAYGLRNPWRFSFDRQTGDLYIADVGQGRYEEINFQPATSTGGENYGWDIMEGLHCFTPMTGCPQTGLTLPVTEYPISGSADCAVTGGYVYRGADHPELRGVYLYGDFCSGRIRGFRARQDGEVAPALLAESGLRISSLGEVETGEVFLADYAGGGLYRIVPAP